MGTLYHLIFLIKTILHINSSFNPKLNWPIYTMSIISFLAKLQFSIIPVTVRLLYKSPGLDSGGIKTYAPLL